MWNYPVDLYLSCERCNIVPLISMMVWIPIKQKNNCKGKCFSTWQEWRYLIKQILVVLGRKKKELKPYKMVIRE
jgi:hypothetical protein